jgi:hypothetical protein
MIVLSSSIISRNAGRVGPVTAEEANNRKRWAKRICKSESLSTDCSGRVKWSRIASRNRMRRQGVEDIKGKMPLAEPPKKLHRKLSKAELRERAEAAFLAWRAGQTSKNK